MKNKIQNDKKKRNLNYRLETKQIILKSFLKNKNLSRTIRWNSELYLSDIKFKTKLVKRCILTGRKSKFNESFRFSRLMFLRLVRNGFISGFKKSAR